MKFSLETAVVVTFKGGLRGVVGNCAGNIHSAGLNAWVLANRTLNGSDQTIATNPNSDATSPNSTPGDEPNDSEATIPSDQVEARDLATD